MRDVLTIAFRGRPRLSEVRSRRTASALPEARRAATDKAQSRRHKHELDGGFGGKISVGSVEPVTAADGTF